MKHQLMSYLTEATIGEDMEKAIISMWNSDRMSGKLNVGIKRQGVSEIVDYLRKEIKGNVEARKVLKSEVSVSDWWKEYSNEHTPKTDIAIGDYNISLKTGPAQLMSGVLKGDTRATFMTAVEKTHNKTVLMKEIIDRIEKIKGSIIVPEEESEDKKLKVLKTLKKVNKMNKELEGMMKTFFEKNQNTKIEFVKEAMTGDRKFGKKSIGRAEYVLYCETNGNSILHPINQGYVKKVSNTVKMNVSFKSSSVQKVIDGEKTKVGQRKYSVVRLATGIVDKFNEEVEMYNGVMLTEGILSDIWNKVSSWFEKVFTQIKNWIGDSMERLLEFLGFLDDEDSIEVDIDDSGVDFS